MSVGDFFAPRTAASPVSSPVTLRDGRARTEPTIRDGGTSRVARPGPDVVVWAVVVDCVALIGAHLVVVPAGWPSMALLIALVLTLNGVGGHYRPRLAPALLDELPGLAARALVAGAIVTVVGVYLGPTAQGEPTAAAIVFLAFACLGRSAAYPLLRRWRCVHDSGRPTVIVGCGTVGGQIAATLLEHPEYGLRPVGYVDDDPFLSEVDRRIPLLGSCDSLPRLIREHPIRDVIVAFSRNSESSMVDVLRRCDRLPCEMFVVPRLHELHAAGESAWVSGLPLTRLRRASHRSLSWKLKRIFDVVAAGLGLLLLSPLLTVCALAVYIEGGRGVIFRQERVGLDGRRFTLLKFRSLTPADETESEQRWSIGADPRLRPVGRTIRRLSLDELPQLWNVVRGDMSLVGPRPERPFFVDDFTQRFPRYAARHRVPAGLTGWAQVNGLRGDTDIADRARFDCYYIESWSMWTDIKIILRTVGQVITMRGL